MLESTSVKQRRMTTGVGETIACANQKGGVGKTTTVVNLASFLALAGDRVLVVDLDPQGNATSALGVERARDRSVYDAVIDDVQLDDLAISTHVDGLTLTPPSIARAGAEVELTPLEQRERRLSGLLDPVRGQDDYILIDCPPSPRPPTIQALTAAGSTLPPTQCEYFALGGLGRLLATIRLITDHLNPRLEIKGAVLTMYNSRTRLSSEVGEEARRHLGGGGDGPTIPR